MIYAGSKAPSESTKLAITGANTNMGFTAYNNEYNLNNISAEKSHPV